MTTEQKALALVNAAKQDSERTIPPFACGLPTMYKALLAAIEAHEADKKAFSDAVKKVVAMIKNGESYNAIDLISPFILPEPEPDPLVELMAFNGLDEALAEQRATNLRKDAADLGYKIIVERIEQ